MRALILVLCLILPLQAGAQSVQLAAEDDWYPYSAKIGGKAVGMSVDIVQAAYRAAGTDVTFAVVPFNRGMVLTKSGTYAGVFNGSPNDAVNRDYLVPKNAVATSRQVVLARTGLPFKDGKSFNGKVLTLTLGYTYPTDITNDPLNKVEYASADINNLKKIAARRADFTIIDRMVALSLLQKNPEIKGEVALVGELSSVELFPLFSRSDHGAQARERYDRGMDLIRTNGTLMKIQSEWESKFK